MKTFRVSGSFYPGWNGCEERVKAVTEPVKILKVSQKWMAYAD
jgi:hypothetical protein